jgi:hypothetical protein
MIRSGIMINLRGARNMADTTCRKGNGRKRNSAARCPLLGTLTSSEESRLESLIHISDNMQISDPAIVLE